MSTSPGPCPPEPDPFGQENFMNTRVDLIPVNPSALTQPGTSGALSPGPSRCFSLKPYLKFRLSAVSYRPAKDTPSASWPVDANMTGHCMSLPGSYLDNGLERDRLSVAYEGSPRCADQRRYRPSANIPSHVYSLPATHVAITTHTLLNRTRLFLPDVCQL